ncbi:uncharacterized protein P884DRAFT_297909 [Thermothelomyces heterothallicus CBS 202.75]|uniref:uncharacterized protein n=1 Tax=Thermothelomyces heterothallicus CBS 202.75 TaxID=1149848 RepID=UPI003742935A
MGEWVEDHSSVLGEGNDDDDLFGFKDIPPPSSRNSRRCSYTPIDEDYLSALFAPSSPAPSEDFENCSTPSPPTSHLGNEGEDKTDVAAILDAVSAARSCVLEDDNDADENELDAFFAAASSTAASSQGPDRPSPFVLSPSVDALSDGDVAIPSCEPADPAPVLSRSPSAESSTSVPESSDEQLDEDALAALFEAATPTLTPLASGNLHTPWLDSGAHEDGTQRPTTATQETPAPAVPTLAAAIEAVAALDDYEARKAAISQMIAAAKAAAAVANNNNNNTPTSPTSTTTAASNVDDRAPGPNPAATARRAKKAKEKPKKPVVLLDRRGLPLDKKARRAELRRRERERPRTAAETEATHATAHLFASSPWRATTRRDKRKAWMVEAEAAADAAAAAAAAAGGWLEEQGGARVPPPAKPPTAVSAAAAAAAANSPPVLPPAEEDERCAKRRATLREMRSRGVEIVDLLLDDSD